MRHGRRNWARGGTAYAADSKSVLSRFESGRAYFGNFFGLCPMVVDTRRMLAILCVSDKPTTNRG